MASVWPAKNNYATGDVLTAANMNGIGDDLNDLYNSYSRAAGKNAVINGGFDIWQRGTSAVTLSAAAFNYTADRFFVARSAGTSGVTATQITSIGLDGFRYGMRIQRTAADTSTGVNYLMSNLETANSIPFANKTVTFSFYARAGANYSATSNALVATLRSGTGTDQSGYTSGWTGSANVLQQTATLTTSWQRFTYSATVSSTATQLGIQFDFTPTGTAGANDYFDITGIQLELGSSATPFSRAGGTIQGELAAAQRYYWRAVAGSAYGPLSNYGAGISTTKVYAFAKYPVTMRITPTALETSNIQVSDLTNNTTANGTFALDNASNDFASVSYTHGSAVFTQYRPYYFRGDNNAAAYIGFSAEL